jgi:hypothetical protein
MEGVKSLIIGRKKVGEDKYNCIITLFGSNDPHLSTESPLSTREFDHLEVEIIKPLSFKFLARGNDIVINDLKNVSITEKDGQIIIDGQQE